MGGSGGLPVCRCIFIDCAACSSSSRSSDYILISALPFGRTCTPGPGPCLHMVLPRNTFYVTAYRSAAPTTAISPLMHSHALPSPLLCGMPFSCQFHFSISMATTTPASLPFPLAFLLLLPFASRICREAADRLVF